MLLALSIAVYPQNGNAEEFTGKDFLRWNASQQHSYIQNSILMSAIIVSETDAAKARCISNWLGKERKTNFQDVITTIRQLPQFHPQATFVSLLEKHCGSLNFRG